MYLIPETEEYDVYGCDEYTWRVSAINERRIKVMDYHIQRNQKHVHTKSQIE